MKNKEIVISFQCEQLKIINQIIKITNNLTIVELINTILKFYDCYKPSEYYIRLTNRPFLLLDYTITIQQAKLKNGDYLIMELL